MCESLRGSLDFPEMNSSYSSNRKMLNIKLKTERDDKIWLSAIDNSSNFSSEISAIYPLK